MPTAILSPTAKQQFFTDGSTVAAGYRLYTYAANTTTPQATYLNRAGTVANQNPIILDARGEAVIYLTPGLVYDYVLKTDQDVTVWTQEDVTADAGDADAVMFRQAGAGAITRTTQDKLRDRVDARDFGVLADGATNDAPGLQAAIDYCSANEKELVLPEGDMVLQAGLVLPAMGKLYMRGSEAGTQGSRLSIKVDAPIITIAANQQGTLENIGFIGEFNGTKTLQAGVYLNDCQNVNIRNCVFDNCYDSIKLLDTVFFCQIETCRFFNVIRSQIYGTGTSGPGYAVRVSGCQVTAPSGGVDTFYFQNAGSLVFSDTMASPATSTGRCLRLVSNAPLSGIHQFDNCVFEGSTLEACRLEGAPGDPIDYVYFSNCYFNQDGPTADAITFVNASNISFVNSMVSGFGAGATFEGACSNIRFVNTDLPGAANPAAFRALPTAAINHLDIYSAAYGGANRFMDLSLMPAANIAAIRIVGGFLGTHANPIALPAVPGASPSQVSVESRGFNMTRSGGITTFDGGVSTFFIPHGLLGTPSRFGVVPNTIDAGNAEIREVTVSSANVVVQCKASAAAGTGNVGWSWFAET